MKKGLDIQALYVIIQSEREKEIKQNDDE